MLRKTVTVAFLFAVLSSQAFSRGLYAGVGLGPEWDDYKQKAHISQLSNFNVIDKTHLAGMGLFGTLFAGYDLCWCNYYLAGEVNLNATNTKFRSSNDEYIHGNYSHTTYQIPYGFGVSVLPGYQINNCTLFYGRLGYAGSNFKVDTTDSSLQNVSRFLNGFRYGLGIKQNIYPHFAVRLEYSQIFYQHTSFSTFDSNSFTYKTTRITPTTGQVEFGLVYSLC